MRIEERLHHDLLDPVLPAALVPPPDLADTVLRGVRRRRAAPLVAVAAAAAAVAIVVPLAVLRPGGDGAPAAPSSPSAVDPAPDRPAPTQLPALGGGPRTLHAFTMASTGRTSLLDVRTGRYQELPYETVLLSPDLRRVAVEKDERVGIADRSALLRDGERAVSWTNLPGGSGLMWSPDGVALLLGTLEKTSSSVSHTVLRYDLRTRLVTSTPVPTGITLIGTPTWAANSRDYLLLPVGAESTQGVRPGPLRVLHPDGTLGRVLPGPGGVVDGPAAYSPSGELMVADTGDIMMGKPGPSAVLDARTGEEVGTLPPSTGTVIGWYDERTVVRLSGLDVSEAALLLLDARTGRTVRTIPLPGVPPLSSVQTGPAGGAPSTVPRF